MLFFLSLLPLDYTHTRTDTHSLASDEEDTAIVITIIIIMLIMIHPTFSLDFTVLANYYYHECVCVSANVCKYASCILLSDESKSDSERDVKKGRAVCEAYFHCN